MWGRGQGGGGGGSSCPINNYPCQCAPLDINVQIGVQSN